MIADPLLCLDASYFASDSVCLPDRNCAGTFLQQAYIVIIAPQWLALCVLLLGEKSSMVELLTMTN